MNERLYRGKRTDNGEWVYGYFGVFKGVSQIFVPFTEEEEKANKGHIFSAIGGLWYTVIPETVGQFAGIEDKNKKPIFDGDIVKTKHGRICRICFTICGGHVGFDMDALEAKNSAPTPYDLWCSYNLEVIGNIHDNPELLEVQP